VLTSTKDVHLIVVVIDGHRADLCELPAFRKLSPTLDQFVSVFTAAYRDCHLLPFRIVAARD
jgi:hypothetical protein